MNTYDSAALYDRKRRINARRRREIDSESAIQTAKAYWSFRDIDTLMSQGPEGSTRSKRVPLKGIVNAEGKVRRPWNGERGHRYPRTAKAQVVKNEQGQNVVVMTKAQRDVKLQEKFGSIHV